MTDTKQARELAVGRLHALLKGCTEPRFEVVPGGVHRLPAKDPVLTYWYAGEAEKGETFANVMVDVVWRVRCMWRMPSNEQEAMALEMQLWHASRALGAQLHSDRDLGGNVTATFQGLATTGELSIGDGENAASVRTLEFDIVIQELEAEEVSL